MNISFIKIIFNIHGKKCSINTWQINEEQNINFIIYFSLQSGNWMTLDVSNHQIHVHRINKYPWRMARQPIPVFLLRESHGQSSLVVYSPWGHRVSHDWSDLPHIHHWRDMEFHQSCPILWVKNQSSQSFSH